VTDLCRGRRLSGTGGCGLRDAALAGRLETAVPDSTFVPCPRDQDFPMADGTRLGLGTFRVRGADDLGNGLQATIDWYASESWRDRAAVDAED